MSDILRGAGDVNVDSQAKQAKEKERLGPWLSAWHDPVADLACSGGCMQVRYRSNLTVQNDPYLTIRIL